MAMLASHSQYVPQHTGGSHFNHNPPPSASTMLSQPSPTNSDFSEGHVILDDIRSWDERKVVEWLRSSGWQQYDSVFEKNNITGEALLECDHSVLRELGITKVGDRVRIFTAVKALRTKAYGNAKKRNRDTLAALDNVASAPNYRITQAQSLSHLTPPSNKRYSRSYTNDSGASVLPSNVYSHSDSPTESDYPQSRQTPRIISPPPDSARSNNSRGTTSTRTPTTPAGWGKPTQGSSPQPPRNIRHHASNSFGGLPGAVRDFCIKVIGDGGATRVIDIRECNTAEAVMRRILKKFAVTDQWYLWAVYSINTDANGRDTARCLGDADLLRVVQDRERPERTRLILKRRGSPPSPSSPEYIAAQAIAREQLEIATSRTAAAIAENANMSKVRSMTGHYPHEIRPASPLTGGLSPVESNRSRDSTSSALGRKQSKKITAFFGQRPPSELISSNLAEYFPDHEHKVLERTVRNSIRRSARMSRYNSRLSVATTQSFGSSISEHSIPPVPTVGNVWLNNNSPTTPVTARPLSVRRSVLMPTTFRAEDYLGAVPEDDVSPVQSEVSDRKSYMSFESRDDVEPVNVVVTDTDSMVSGGYLDTRDSIISTISIETDVTQPSFINQLFNPEDTDEEDDDDDLDGDMDTLRWMKGTLIGSGSFGSVYLALNALTGELMAVKQVEMPTTDQEDKRKQSMIDALSREIALLKELQHPNIVQYLASNKEDNCFNIFLEYVPGGSVAAMLNNYGPLKEPLIRNFVRQILNGLAYLHGKNIIHRDIKGANVLVDNKGGIKISDFGISKKVEAGLLTSSSAHHRPSLQGSVFWMAPEVVKQTSYTLKADIWSLGCLIVEMFTGSHPYPDCSQLQAIFKIGTSGSAPQIPQKSTAEAKTFLAQTFELDHLKRPTADELLSSPFLLPLVGQGSQGD